jgi:phosphatidylglycerophosphate synthase
MSIRDATPDVRAQRLTLSVAAHLATAGILLGVLACGIARETGLGPRYVVASLAWGTAVAIIVLVTARHQPPPVPGRGNSGDASFLRKLALGRFGPANRVTLVRGMLVALIGGTIGLVDGAGPAGWCVFLAAVIALILDGVDGWVARHAGVCSAFGARFDRELDALFLVVLSSLVHDLGKAGAWVLAIGGLRYGFVAARLLWPQLGADLPESTRRKLVCALQGVALTTCLAPVVGQGLASVLAGGALAALTVSFAVDVAWLNRNARDDRGRAR